jgi:hypothetical protein
MGVHLLALRCQMGPASVIEVRMTNLATLIGEAGDRHLYRLDPPITHTLGAIHEVLVTRIGGEYVATISNERGGSVTVNRRPIILAEAGGECGSWVGILDVLGYNIVSIRCGACGDPDATVVARDITGRVVTDCDCAPPSGVKRSVIEGLVAA